MDWAIDIMMCEISLAICFALILRTVRAVCQCASLAEGRH
jgi:hypothetical protein